MPALLGEENMREVDIVFNDVKCKCGGYAARAVRSKHQYRYSLYCGNCGQFIKFASAYNKVIIKARLDYLREHGE